MGAPRVYRDGRPAKYHISPLTGKPGLCRASVQDCPYSSQSQHFDSREEAENYIIKTDPEFGDLQKRVYATHSKLETLEERLAPEYLDTTPTRKSYDGAGLASTARNAKAAPLGIGNSGARLGSAGGALMGMLLVHLEENPPRLLRKVLRWQAGKRIAAVREKASKARSLFDAKILDRGLDPRSVRYPNSWSFPGHGDRD